MTIAANPELRERGISPHVSALLAVRERVSGGLLVWPEGLRCDLINAPLDACCGVIAQLAAASVTVCPIAQIGDRLLFLVADGSVAACGEAQEGLPDGVVMSSTAKGFPLQETVTTATSSCWVIPPRHVTSALPIARLVLAAIRSAYAEDRASINTKTT